METFFKTMLALHIAAGSTGLIVAPIAMLTAKGGRAHRFWGQVFFWAMAGVASSAVFMSIYHPNLFLFAIAFFSFQLACNGYRALAHKPVNGKVSIHWVDWLGVAVGLVASAGLFWMTWMLFAQGSSFGYVALFFGGISLFIAVQHTHKFLYPSPDPKAWWYAHMRGMMTSYVAMVTAFSAVNFNFLPPVVQWLWPSFLGVPLIIAWIRHYRGKFRRVTVAQELTAQS